MTHIIIKEKRGEQKEEKWHDALFHLVFHPPKRTLRSHQFSHSVTWYFISLPSSSSAISFPSWRIGKCIYVYINTEEEDKWKARGKGSEKERKLKKVHECLSLKALKGLGLSLSPSLKKKKKRGKSLKTSHLHAHNNYSIQEIQSHW